MGTLYYGSMRTPINLDDRVLAHLKVVVTSKLRRNEAFLLSWDEPAENGSGRASVFIHPTCDLIYRFDGSRHPELDSELLETMSAESMSARGLVIDATMATIPISSRA
ncbi:MAG: hypothetical protein ABI566_02660 [Pseudolysinimonas sp.]